MTGGFPTINHCIRLLKLIAEKGKFGAFSYYCWAVGLLTLLLCAIK